MVSFISEILILIGLVSGLNIWKEGNIEFYIYKKQNFFITSHHLGDIHLRKLVEIKNIEVESNDPKTASIQAQNNSKSVHIFKGHSKAVTALAPIESKQS